MIGWYLHHHGQGHLNRLRAVAAETDAEIAVFSSLPEPARPVTTRRGPVEWVHLPPDWEPEPGVPDPAAAEPTAGGALHWAPLRHEASRDRLRTLADWSPRLTAMVVDVSVEAALFSRLLGLPVLLVAQAGERLDEPHLTALRAASVILAPFPEFHPVWDEGLDPAPHTRFFPEKTVFLGGISAHADAAPQDAAGERPERGPDVVFIGSRGGSLATLEDVAAAQGATGLTWEAVGLPGAAWCDDVPSLMRRAGVVVINAGLGAVADAAALKVRAVVLAQERPFGEQLGNTAMLAELGVPVAAGWPAPQQWPDLIARARAFDPARWEQWRTSGSAARAARIIEEYA